MTSQQTMTKTKMTFDKAN